MTTEEPASGADPGVSSFADTPPPPYLAVIFTSTRTAGDHGYTAMASAMEQLASEQPGFLGIESAREGIGITVSYWQNEECARAWKSVAAHLVAQRRGRDCWYNDYRVRIATVTRDYGRDTSELRQPPSDGDTTARDRVGGIAPVRRELQ